MRTAFRRPPHGVFDARRAARVRRSDARAVGRQAGRVQAVRRPSLGILGHVQGHAGDRHPARLHRRRRRRGRHRRRAAEFPDHVGTPLLRRAAFVRNALVGTGLRDRIRIGASGKVVERLRHRGGACALGADWCNAARAFMFSLGCVQSMRCHTGTCPTGIATQDPLRQRALVVPDRARRVAAFHAATLDKLAQIVAAAGLRSSRRPTTRSSLHPRRRGAPCLEGLSRAFRRRTAAEPNATPFAEAWRLADADSFAPRL